MALKETLWSCLTQFKAGFFAIIIKNNYVLIVDTFKRSLNESITTRDVLELC